MLTPVARERKKQGGVEKYSPVNSDYDIHRIGLIHVSEERHVFVARSYLFVRVQWCFSGHKNGLVCTLSGDNIEQRRATNILLEFTTGARQVVRYAVCGRK